MHAWLTVFSYKEMESTSLLSLACLADRHSKCVLDFYYRQKEKGKERLVS